MRLTDIPEVIVQRLPLYLRAVELLADNNIEIVSSNALGDLLGITPAQVRKDLSCFGRFGKQGKGYNVARLHKELKSIIGLEHKWSMVLVGVGDLGRAILSYEGFEPQGFKIVACFDNDPKLIGKTLGIFTIQDISQLEQKLKQGDIDIVIVAVPKDQAEKVIDTSVKCGIKAILNYAPICARVPEGVNIRNVDPVVALQMLTFHLTNDEGNSKLTHS